ncbi:related to YPI1 - inhibitor of the type I protein phosphatase Glc7p [Ustilago sp. UG-2017a]|nr:related to YPI1 - inhibitor of the type I protein phosphatase Glc7p [Ustilago sp. UG-2017a]
MSNQPAPAASSFRTITLTATHPTDPHPSSEDSEAGILRLRPTAAAFSSRSPDSSRRRVVWTENTVDNEGLGRKKSKICCIYHKPKAFGESSDESSSSSSSDGTDSSSGSESESSADGPDLSQGLKEKLKQKQNSGCENGAHENGPHHHHHHHHHGKHRKPKGTKTRSGGTQTITVTEKGDDKEVERSDDDDDEEDAGRFRPNAYERGPK